MNEPSRQYALGNITTQEYIEQTQPASLETLCPELAGVELHPHDAKELQAFLAFLREAGPLEEHRRKREAQTKT